MSNEHFKITPHYGTGTNDYSIYASNLHVMYADSAKEAAQICDALNKVLQDARASQADRRMEKDTPLHQRLSAMSYNFKFGSEEAELLAAAATALERSGK